MNIEKSKQSVMDYIFLQDYVNVVGNGANDKVEDQLKELIEGLGDNDPKYKRLKVFYNDCTKESILERLGVQPLKNLLLNTGGLDLDISDWTASDATKKWFDYIYNMRNFGSDDHILMSASVYEDEKDNNNRIINSTT